MTEPNTEHLSNFKQFIANSVTQHWQKNQSAFMLSTLGVLLRENSFDISTITAGKRLADFVEEQLPELKVVKFSESAQKIGVVPANVVFDDNYDKFFIKVEKPIRNAKKPPDIPNVLWFAFTRPLASDFSRYVFSKPKLSYKDVAEQQESKIVDGSKVDKDLIHPEFESDARVRNQLIKNIRGWMEVNNLIIPLSIPGLDKKETKIFPVKSTDSLLHKIISSLSNDELSRTTLPLDVVARLLNVS